MTRSPKAVVGRTKEGICLRGVARVANPPLRGFVTTGIGFHRGDAAKGGVSGAGLQPVVDEAHPRNHDRIGAARVIVGKGVEVSFRRAKAGPQLGHGRGIQKDLHRGVRAVIPLVFVHVDE